MPDQVADYFIKHGVILVQGYGMTESSPVISTGTLTEYRTGTVGKPIPGVEVKIAPDGEILTRGPHMMVGYWNLPKDTAETLRDGWLHTGDLGAIEDGYLRITGRKKELIVTAGGKNIAPSYLEGLLTEDPLIAQAVVVGDARNYLTALIVPNPDGLRAEIISRRNSRSFAGRGPGPPGGSRVVYRANQPSPGRSFARPSRCGNSHWSAEGVTMETDDMTRPLKVRRNVVMKNFASQIQAMYEDNAPGD